MFPRTSQKIGEQLPQHEILEQCRFRSHRHVLEGESANGISISFEAPDPLQPHLVWGIIGRRRGKIQLILGLFKIASCDYML